MQSNMFNDDEGLERDGSYSLYVLYSVYLVLALYICRDIGRSSRTVHQEVSKWAHLYYTAGNFQGWRINFTIIED